MKGKRLISVGAAVLVFAVCSGCNFNLFKEVAPETSDRALLEQARVQIDEKQFARATTTLSKVKNDSNYKRLLEVSAKLGGVGFGLWSLILDLTESGDFKKSGSKGFDYIFDTFSEALLGEGEERTKKLASFGESVQILQSAPQSDDAGVSTLRCLLAGLMVYPTVSDSQNLLEQATSDLNQIVESAQGGGENAEDCPDIDLLATTMETVTQVQTNLDTILEGIQDCDLLDVSEEQAKLNEVEKRINSLTTNADKGCVETPSCGSSEACDALQLGCVQEVVNESESVAGDGLVSTCELLQNCVAADCFAD
ncbi:MAG: hypothetical protein AB7T49_12350 [Oligoflexales bacterium]